MAKPIMKCGHSANAVNGRTGAPCCVICYGDPNAEIVDENPPDLTGRKARCAYYGHKCHSEMDSHPGLAFFKHRPEREFDEYYCGCWGWN